MIIIYAIIFILAVSFLTFKKDKTETEDPLDYKLAEQTRINRQFGQDPVCLRIRFPRVRTVISNRPVDNHLITEIRFNATHTFCANCGAEKKIKGSCDYCGTTSNNR